MNSESKHPFGEVFEQSRQLETLKDGSKNIEDIGEVVQKTIFRTSDGEVRGISVGFLRADGIIKTIQNDTFTLMDNGEIASLRTNENVDVHQALPMETQHITGLELDGRSFDVEISGKGAGELFGGELQPNQPLMMLDAKGNPERIVVAVPKTVTKSQTIDGTGTITIVSTVELYDPLINAGENGHDNMIAQAGSAENEIPLSRLKYITDLSESAK